MHDGCAAHENAAAGESAHGRDHGGRGGEDQSAGAGDDENGDRAQPVAREVEREGRGKEQCGKKVLGGAIGEAFDRRAFSLRFLDQLDDAGKGGFVAGFGDANAQEAVAVESAGEDFVADLFIARQRFAGDGAFVDGRCALIDDAVGRDAFAGADYDDVVGNERGGVDFFLASIAQDAGAARDLLDEFADGGGGASGGVGFEPFADEHDEHGFGGGQVFADREGGDDGDAEREVGGDFLFEERGDGVVKRLVAGEQGDEDCGVDPEERLEDARQIQRQQYADAGCKAVISNSFLVFLVHGWFLG